MAWRSAQNMEIKDWKNRHNYGRRNRCVIIAAESSRAELSRVPARFSSAHLHTSFTTRFSHKKRRISFLLQIHTSVSLGQQLCSYAVIHTGNTGNTGNVCAKVGIGTEVIYCIFVLSLAAAGAGGNHNSPPISHLDISNSSTAVAPPLSVGWPALHSATCAFHNGFLFILDYLDERNGTERSSILCARANDAEWSFLLRKTSK